MHASSGQENITCGETARGPKEGEVEGREGEERGGAERRRGAKGEEQQTGIQRESEKRMRYNIRKERKKRIK